MRVSTMLRQVRIPLDRFRDSVRGAFLFPFADRKKNRFTEANLRRQQERLHVSEARFRLILDTTHEAFVAMDEKGNITDWNPQAEVTFGYSREEAIGRVLADTIVPQRYRQAHWSGLHRFLETGKGPVLNHRLEMPAVRRNGEEFMAELTIAAFRFEERPYFAAFLHDISGRKKAEEERNEAIAELKDLSERLARSNGDLEQFASAASHDLQEPLRAISGCLQILREDYRDRFDDQAEKLIDNSLDGVRRMQQLISDLLTYSRLTSRTGSAKPVDCARIVENVIRNLDTAINESRAVIIRDQLPVVQGDPAQFAQLFQNLIGNAIKYRGERAPEIHVGCRPRDGDWLFSIRDNGIGMEPQYFDRIFRLFQRLHTRKSYPGTGMGLAICKKVVEHYGGRIRVESEPGKGSTFTFTLPQHEEEEKHESETH